MSVESIKNEVAEKVSTMIFEGAERKDIVKKIREEYKGTGLTTAEINVFYKKGLEAFNKFVKEENLEVKKSVKIKESIEANDINKAVGYIFGENEKEIKPLKEKKLPKKEEKVEVVKETVKTKDPVKESKLKVINKVVKVVEADIAGSHGNYHIENGVVNIKDTELAFANVAALKNWASDEREALLKKLGILNGLESEVEEVFKEFM